MASWCNWLTYFPPISVQLSLLPGFGSAAPAPRYLGTQLPCGARALNEVKYTYLTYLMTRSMLLSSLYDVKMALVFISGFGGMLWRLFCC